MRNILHRFVSYTKRIGRYTVKVEHLDGHWHVWVFGPALAANKTKLLHGESKKLWDFSAARAYGLRWVRGHANA